MVQRTTLRHLTGVLRPGDRPPVDPDGHLPADECSCASATTAALLAKAHEAKVIRLDKVRADTAAVEANGTYPTDFGVVGLGRGQAGALTVATHAAGLASGTTSRDPTRSIRRRAHRIGAWLRRRNDEAKSRDPC